MRRLLVVACLIIFVDVAFYEAIAPLLVDYRGELGLGERDAGILVGSYAVGSVLLSLPAGFVVSRLGPRRVLVAALVTFGASASAFGFLESFELLVAARFVQGAAGAALWVGSLSWLVASAPPERRGAVIGIAIGVAVIGALLGPLIGALASQIGTEPVFGSVLVVSLLVAAAALSIPDAPVHGRNRPGAAARALASRRVAPAAGMVMLPSTSLGLATVLVPLRIDDLGGGSLLVAAGFAAGGLIQASSSPLVGRLSDRRGRMLPFALGSVVGAAGIALIPVPSIPVVLGALAGVALGAGASFAPGFARLADNADRAGLHQGLAAGLSNVAWASGQIAGAVLGGALAEATVPLVPCLAVSLALVAGALASRGRMRLA